MNYSGEGGTVWRMILPTVPHLLLRGTENGFGALTKIPEKSEEEGSPSEMAGHIFCSALSLCFSTAKKNPQLNGLKMEFFSIFPIIS